MSPGGVITLPVSARKTLRMEPGRGARVSVAMLNDSISLRPDTDKSGARVSPKGQMVLVGEPRNLLENAMLRHYWLELDDEKQTVLLYPFADQQA